MASGARLARLTRVARHRGCRLRAEDDDDTGDGDSARSCQPRAQHTERIGGCGVALNRTRHRPPKNPGFLTQIRTRLCERVHCFALFSELDYCARRSCAVGCCTIGTKTILEIDNEYQETA